MKESFKTFVLKNRTVRRIKNNLDRPLVSVFKGGHWLLLRHDRILYFEKLDGGAIRRVSTIAIEKAHGGGYICDIIDANNRRVVNDVYRKFVGLEDYHHG